jgi:hypothetical protein
MMANKSTNDFLPLLIPELPGCPEETMRAALAAVSADFCARTYLWREPLAPQNTAADKSTYDITDCAVVESVLWMLIDGDKLIHSDPRHMRQEDFDRKGKPTHFWVVSDTAVRLFPIPDDTYPITAEVVLKPSRAARTIPSWIFETWADAITSGAIWWLAKTPGKEWSNPDLAMMHRKIFEQAIAQARIRDYRNVPLSVAMRPFA